MNRKSTVMGTEGIKYALFELYINNEKKSIKYDLEAEVPLDQPINVNNSLTDHNDKIIFTADAIKYGIDKLEPGIYAVVYGTDNTKYESLVKEKEGADAIQKLDPRIRLFYAFEEEIYIASSYKGYPVVALAYEGLEGSNPGGDGVRVPWFTNDNATLNNKYRSKIKKIILPESIVIFDDYSLHSHNCLEELIMPKNIWFLGHQVIGYTNLKELKITNLVYGKQGALVRVSGFGAGINTPPTEIIIDNYKGSNNLLYDPLQEPRKYTILFGTRKVSAPVSIISLLQSNLNYGSGIVKFRVQGDSKMSILNQPIINSDIEVLSFSPEAEEIDYFPIISTLRSDGVIKLKEVYIEGLPKITKEIKDKASLFDKKITTIDQTIYFSHSKEEIEASLQSTEYKMDLDTFLCGRTAYYNYKPKVTEDNDFIAFTYGGVHSLRDLKIYRTSNSNRYQFNAKNPSQDKTQKDPNVDGTLYTYSQLEPLTFSVSFAYDNLCYEDIRKIKQTFNGKEVKELVFEEYPYKVYEAKVTGTPTLTYNVFDDYNGKTVYKGTGTVTFTCYYPYAHTPTDLRNGVDGKYLNHYFQSEFEQPIYPTFYEWKDSCGLLKSTDKLNNDLSAVDDNTYVEKITVCNRGETSGPFVLTFKGYVPKGTIIKADNGQIKISESCYDLEFNSQTGQLTGRSVTKFITKTWQRTDYEGTAETTTDVNYFSTIVIDYANLNKTITHGNFQFSERRAIKYQGSPFLTISPSLDGFSDIEIFYNTNEDPAVSVINIGFAQKNGINEQEAYRTFIMNLWNNNTSGGRRYNDNIANGLNFLFQSERTIDYQVWYY